MFLNSKKALSKSISLRLYGCNKVPNCKLSFLQAEKSISKNTSTSEIFINFTNINAGFVNIFISYYEFLKTIIAKLVYLCKIYIHETFNLPEMSK